VVVGPRLSLWRVSPPPLDCGGMTPLFLHRDSSPRCRMIPDGGAKAPSCRRSPKGRRPNHGRAVLPRRRESPWVLETHPRAEPLRQFAPWGGSTPRCQSRAPALRAGRGAAAARPPYHDEKMRQRRSGAVRRACQRPGLRLQSRGHVGLLRFSYPGPDAGWLQVTQPFMASNPAIASRLQSLRPERRGAELGSLGVCAAPHETA
jgi:hypothetical protein